ncbi:MAG: hypothetical protein LBP52_07515 [Burkholderiaceae bacterium]|jgi:hypothetical protein|nr:hypothetical protein [Burkholderiaceae bacterium]
MTRIRDAFLGIGLFCLSLLVIKESSRAFVVALLAFRNELGRGNLFLLWMSVYWVVSFLGIFLAFKLTWLSNRVLIVMGVAVGAVGLAHGSRFSCPGGATARLAAMDAFAFLGCFTHNLSWLGLVLSALVFLVCLRNVYERQ